MDGVTKEDEFGAFFNRRSPKDAPKKEKTATANRSRLVRRDLREINFLKKQKSHFLLFPLAPHGRRDGKG